MSNLCTISVKSRDAALFDEFVTLCQVVKSAYDAAEQLVHVGTSTSALDQAARQVIQESGYGEYFTHSTGHGV